MLTPTSFLLLSIDTTLAGLVRLNLERRGFAVHEIRWAACCRVGESPRGSADLVIADLDCPAPDCWNGAPHLRELFPPCPLLLLAHDRPGRRHLQDYQPCVYLQKPFAVDELIRAVSALSSSVTS